jgi:hypothetical protein
VIDRLDPRALREGAVVAAVVAVPAGVVGRVLSDRPNQPDWLWLLVVLVLAGLVAGAAVAASRQDRGFPLTHGVVTAVGVFVAVQAVGILIRLLRGDSISWSRVTSSLLLSFMAGLVGGLLGSVLLAQRAARR